MTQTYNDVTSSGAEPNSAGFGGPEERTARATTGDKVIGGVSHTVLVIWSLLVIVPMVWVIVSSFKTSSEIFASPFALPHKLNFSNYANAWTTAGSSAAT
jgi:N-acetylglucosamine transport system permease protein